MADSVSFKAYLKREGQDIEVRRFGIATGAATNYAYLKRKIQAMFASIENDQFSLFWQDSDNDYISISTDEELLEANTSNTAQPFKIYIHIKSQQQEPGASTQQVHNNIICDGCERPVVGRRFKCVTCPDFDLCSKCEAAGMHSKHFMLRIISPLPSSVNPRLFRKLFSGRPHKFFKHAGWGHMGGGERGQCPFARCEREGTFEGGCSGRRGGEGPSAPTPGASAGAGAGIGAVTDMFDFSAIMDFINSLGVSMATGRRQGAEPMAATASTSASASAQAHSSARPSGATDNAQGAQPQPIQCLNNIGQAIAAFLNPFGVDVSFEVRPKPTESQNGEQATPTAPNVSPANTPTPTPAAPNMSPANTPTPTPTASNVSPAIPTPTAPNMCTANTPTPTPTASNVSPAIPTPTAHNMCTANTAIPTPADPNMSPANTKAPTPTPTPQPQRENTPPSTSHARRASDDWILLNRESPTRNIEAVPMEVEDSRGARPRTVYSELSNDALAAPVSNILTLEEDRKVKEAIDKIRLMGFNFNTALLKHLLRTENCNIPSVIEKLLKNKN